ncbi:15224_t:CDS:2, partial [Funneliformis geosporum]
MEQGLFYLGKRRIYFFDLFSFRKARGKIARGTIFQEIVYEEAIPIDQEFLPSEQWKFRDLIESLKRKGDNVFKNLNKLRKEAETKKTKQDNSGVLEIVKDEKG